MGLKFKAALVSALTMVTLPAVAQSVGGHGSGGHGGHGGHGGSGGSHTASHPGSYGGGRTGLSSAFGHGSRVPFGWGYARPRVVVGLPLYWRTSPTIWRSPTTIIETVGPAPEPGAVWVPGYQAWDPVYHSYTWVPGRWDAPQQESRLWVSPHWENQNGSSVFMPGYWGGGDPGMQPNVPNDATQALPTTAGTPPAVDLRDGL